MGDRSPSAVCLEKHGSNSTLEFHECMCQYDYSYAKSRIKALKMKHCHEAAAMYRMDNFYNYIIIAVVIIFSIVAFVAAVCSFKWYLETKTNPCSCCSFFCCCARRKKRKVKKKSRENQAVNVFEHAESGHTWSPVNLPPPRDEETIPSTPPEDSKNSSVCMSFCLSDPVQDCCEFFDCDIMWRKKSIYTIPIFGKKKHLQRRPTRPAPLPPKAVVLPQVKNPESSGMFEEYECEPVPEAPPSPEPVRTLPPKAMYVDPLAFLQRTFAKNSQPEKDDSDEPDGKQEALYCKFKNMVLAKVKKSVSMASINKFGVSSDTNGVSSNPSGSSCSKKMKTASLASLHNLGEAELDSSYGSKRSLSLASLHMLQDQGAVNNAISLDPRSRNSVLSTVSTATDDIPPSARKNEYVALEEMSKRIEAKMQAARSLKVSPASSPVPHIEPIRNIQPPPVQPSSAYTPNFMPASAFVAPPNPSSFIPIQADVTPPPQKIVYDTRDMNKPPQYCDISKPPQYCDIRSFERPPQYFPPVPASQGRPAVPARNAVGTPLYTMSPSGTLTRPKPAIPPRPPIGEAARPPSSPRTSTLPRSPRLVKPSGPPPPPPQGKTPIESAI